MEMKFRDTYKGTRILYGESAKKKRDLINDMIDLLYSEGFNEMMLPIIQKQEIFAGKVGTENNNMMYTFKDKGERDLCLAPEYTAVIQQSYNETFKYEKDVKIFYIGECFRGEKPQAGRYRQFTQLGLEIINPKMDYLNYLQNIAVKLISIVTNNFVIDNNVVRGLDYYKGGKGFEIVCPELGAQKQVCGGGEYEGGVGFAIGLDRLLLLK